MSPLAYSVFAHLEVATHDKYYYLQKVFCKDEQSYERHITKDRDERRKDAFPKCSLTSFTHTLYCT